MTATDLAAVSAILVALVAAGLVVGTLVVVVRVLADLRAVVVELRSATLPLVADLRRHVDAAGDELERVDAVLARAERISTTVDDATRLTHRALGTPVVKALSVAAGAGRVSWRLRRRRRGVIDVGTTSRTVPARPRRAVTGSRRVA